MIKIAVVGYGYWGPNMVRTFNEVPGSQVVAVCDLRPQRLSVVQSRYPAIKITTDAKELLTDPSIDAIIISYNSLIFGVTFE